MAMKREPDEFNEWGPGGTHHRYNALSKADWADAYGDLYRQCFGDEATPEAILDDAERRDDLRHYAASQKPARHPRKKATR